MVKISNKNDRKVVNIFLSIVLTFVLDAQMNRLIESVLLTTHNICFGRENQYSITFNKGLGLRIDIDNRVKALLMIQR